MAEIRIEQKRRSLGWLWALLILLVLAAVAWYLYSQRGMRVSGVGSQSAAPALVRPAALSAMPGLAFARSRHARRRPITA